MLAKDHAILHDKHLSESVCMKQTKVCWLSATPLVSVYPSLASTSCSTMRIGKCQIGRKCECGCGCGFLRGRLDQVSRKRTRCIGASVGKEHPGLFISRSALARNEFFRIRSDLFHVLTHLARGSRRSRTSFPQSYCCSTRQGGEGRKESL